MRASSRSSFVSSSTADVDIRAFSSEDTDDDDDDDDDDEEEEDEEEGGA